MNPESLLQRLRDSRPNDAIQDRIRARVQARIAQESPLFASLKKQVTPSKVLQKVIWSKISGELEPETATALQGIHDDLTPSEALRQIIAMRVFPRLAPLHHPLRTFRYFKWTAAFAAFALVVRMSPALFVVSPTLAESEALLVPTNGTVTVSIGGLWQDVHEEMVLHSGMKLRTREGQASIILHDNAVIRMDSETSIELQDIADRVEPASEVFPTITLLTGRVWLQGLVPARLRGITIATTHGQVTVNEGSVSVAEDDVVNVEVYDRRSVVTRNGQDVILTTGERVELKEAGVLLVKKIPEKWFQREWADQNLQRDAVHRREIAQLQHERRIAQAGILPTSRLYSVKRLAEKVDVLLTFDSQTRVEKELQQAETRLNEAAALISDTEKANTALDEYRATLNRLASQGTEGSLAQFLVQRALSESSAKVAAVLPGDDSYVIKKTVLEASAGLPDQLVRTEDVQGEFLLDSLAVMMESMSHGDVTAASTVWKDLQPYLHVIDAGEIALHSPVRKEAGTLLAFLATSLHEASINGAAVDPEVLEDIAAYLPPQAATRVVLTDEQVAEIAQQIRSQIFAYNLTQPRINQFILETRVLQGHPDEGRILRRLAQILPDGPEAFPDKVFKEIVRLRWNNASEAI